MKKDNGIKEKLEKIGADIGYNIASSFLGDAVLVSNDFLWGYHLDRNNMNRIVDFKTVFKENWILLIGKESVYHRIGKGNENNLKFVSPDGHHEAVFKEVNGHFQRVTDMENLGTYNICSPKDKIGHLIYDINPYYFVGCGGYEKYHYLDRGLATAKALFGICKPNYEIILELKALAIKGKFDRAEYEMLSNLYLRQYSSEIEKAKLKKEDFILRRDNR